VERSNEVIDSLLDLDNISLNEQDCDGCTPLHYVADRCEESVLIKLLEKSDSISINAKDNVGDTPLHYAVRASRYQTIPALLVDAGANSKDRLHSVEVYNRRNPAHLTKYYLSPVTNQ
jgi:ankyrin repeat protein